MKWFEGSIPEAIQAAKANSAVFIVYISGDDDMSKQMEEVWNDTAVCELCEKERCVGLSMDQNSDGCKQFGQIYPVMCVPCTFFISNNGVPLEVVGGHLEKREFYKKIQNATQMHKDMQHDVAAPVGASDGASAPELTATPAPVPKASTPTDAQPTAAIEETPPKEQPQPTASSTSSTSTEPTEQSPEKPSTSQAPQLSVEERVQRAKEVIEEKRRQKAAQEKEEEKKKEKERRQLGSEMNRLKKMQADMEAEEIRQARNKEKKEAREARERVRQQIAADRADRLARSQREKEERLQQSAATAQPSASSDPAAPPTSQTRSETARLQFRLPDGRAITNQFQSSDTLEVAMNFLANTVSSLGAFRLSTTYPKQIFTREDMSSTLLDLNLAPSAVIVVLPGGMGTAPVAQTDSVFSMRFLTMIVSFPFITLWNFIHNFFMGSPAPSHSHSHAARAADQRAARPEASMSRPQKPSDSQPSSSTRNRPKSSYGVRRQQEGNVHRFSADDSDDEQATWNGNSTQQM